jgi:hypothetical protein
MGRNTLNWILTIILILVILVLLPGAFSFGRGHMGYAGYRHPMHSGQGMMAPGMFGLWWIIPGIILVLIIALGVWVGNLLSTQKGYGQSHQNETCPNCSQEIASDWKTCPYCSKKL